MPAITRPGQNKRYLLGSSHKRRKSIYQLLVNLLKLTSISLVLQDCRRSKLVNFRKINYQYLFPSENALKRKMFLNLHKEDESYILFKTNAPNPIPRKVATAIPKIPARIPGTINEVQPLAVAIPQAVVGPPTFAFEAISNNFFSKPRIFPIPKMMARCTAT